MKALIAALGLALCALPARAGDNPVLKFKGGVVSVDAVANTLVVTTTAGEVTLAVASTTEFIDRHGDDVTFAELKAFDRVKVKATLVEGKLVAELIVEVEDYVAPPAP